MADPAMKIEVPGEIIVNDGVARFPGQVDVLRIDLRSKRARVSATSTFDGAPAVGLGIHEGTLHTDELMAGVDTWVSFPSHIGWRVLCAEVCRYTLTVVLGKDADLAQEGKAS